METVVQKTKPNVTAQSICHKAKICGFFIARICKCKGSEYLWLDLQAMGGGQLEKETTMTSQATETLTTFACKFCNMHLENITSVMPPL